MKYDIIGDVHGHSDKLECLLIKLKYKLKNGVYQHEDRKAVFVGDLIDRGTQNRRVIEVVRHMVEENHAYAIMGNHEYNAICYHTQSPTQKWLRPHSDKNIKQHENFLNEYPLRDDDTNDVIDWFKSLPLFIEFDEFRIIHACWDEKIIELSKPYRNDDDTLKDEYYKESADKNKKDNLIYQTIETLLKGVEITLP